MQIQDHNFNPGLYLYIFYHSIMSNIVLYSAVLIVNMYSRHFTSILHQYGSFFPRVNWFSLFSRCFHIDHKRTESKLVFPNLFWSFNKRSQVVRVSWPLLLLNSHGRHMSVYFAVYQTLVLAFRVAEIDGKLQLAARPSGMQPAVD